MVQYLQKIPPSVCRLIDGFHESGFEAYIVGGCVRDLLCGNTPSDWDVATNASPEQITAVFPDSYSDNKFGTVTVRMGQLETPDYMEIEVTPYRIESKYTDKRHPDKVEWADNINDDLSRRDFTINAIALGYIKEGNDCKIEVIDLYGGQNDLKLKFIRAVRDPDERFLEDALRMMRAVRFAVTLGKDWRIDPATEIAIKNNAKWLKEVSQERIRDEFIKMIMSPRAAEGIELLRRLDLLHYILPELLEGYGVSQNKHHIFDCYQHSVKALEFAAQKGFSMPVRMASLLHDIGKPRAKAGEGPNSTFYNHEMIGAKMTKKFWKGCAFPIKMLKGSYVSFAIISSIIMSARSAKRRSAAWCAMWEKKISKIFCGSAWRIASARVAPRLNLINCATCAI